MYCWKSQLVNCQLCCSGGKRGEDSVWVAREILQSTVIESIMIGHEGMGMQGWGLI